MNVTSKRYSAHRPPIALFILAAIAAGGLIVGIVRLIRGLGPTTNLNDGYPWGLWIGLDVFLIPVAGAAFSVSAVSHFFGRDDITKSCVRPF